MLKKNCHQVLRSQKSKLTPIELVFETAGAINPPPPYKDRVKGGGQPTYGKFHMFRRFFK